MRDSYWLGLLFIWALCSCTDSPIPGRPSPHVARTVGGAVVLSRDERIAVVSNRSAGVVTVFSLAPERGPSAAMITSKTELDTGAGSEPWAAVIGADDDTAYVLFRESQTVARVTSLHTEPTLQSERVAVGSEPTAIAISGSGEQLFVANWGEGTVSIIRTKTFGSPDARDPTVDLNTALSGSGLTALGDVAARPALAHPRALAVTDDGDQDDEDETLYATEFFSQPLPNVKPEPDLSDVDKNRQGIVYRISLETGQSRAISVAPVLETGFSDGAGRMTSCFPNQLYAAAINGGRLYVTAMCTSPRGPLGATDVDGKPTDKNFKTLFHPAVFVIDTVSNKELPEAGRLLTQVLARHYDHEDDTQARMPLIPNDIAFISSGNGSTAYVSALGADALFRLEYDESGTLKGIGSPGARQICVPDTKVNTLPVGLALSTTSAHPFALVANDGTQQLWIVDRATERVVSVDAAPDTPHAVDTRGSAENKGRKLFATGRDVWSFKGQAWSSCESCHPGGLSDGVTWFFARGPRRTISTAGTYDKSPNLSDRTRRMLLWGANVDEIHDVEAIVRTVSGGPGAILWNYTDPPSNECRLVYDGTAATHNQTPPCLEQKETSQLQNGLNGSLAALVNQGAFCGEEGPCDSIGSTDWDKIDAFIRSIRAPRAPTRLVQSDIDEGHALFVAGKCAGCHGGKGWTISKLFYQPGAEENGTLPFKRPESGPLELGKLREQTYQVSNSLRHLNPPAMNQDQPTLRTAPSASEADPTAYVYTTTTAANEQIQCALRDVGTFPSQASGESFIRPSAPGAPAVFEYRQDMKTLAQGANGFNVPSLFGLAEGAPYFHAGNARSLEEVFDETFSAHYRALAPDFLGDPLLRSHQIALLVKFLLSIDETTAIAAVPTTDRDADGKLNYDFCAR